MTNGDVRKIALEEITKIMEEGVFTHHSLRQVLFLNSWLPDQQKAFLTRLIEGTVERCIALDWILDQVSSVKVRKMKPLVRNLMRMSVYQIYFMDSVPDYSACNEAVRLIQGTPLRNLKGFVNGVLRNICRQKEALLAKMPEKISCCLPDWLYKMWEKEYGIEQTLAMAKDFLEEKEAVVTVRRNRTRISKEDLEASFRDASFEYELIDELLGVYHLKQVRNLGENLSFLQGDFFVQDYSSVLAGACVAPKKDSFCLDVCAAPGGKSVFLAEQMENTGRVIARDLDDRKQDLVEDNMERLGFSNVEFQPWDALELDESMIGQVDYLLADLPCSGLGVIGKKPDIRYHASLEKLKDLQQLQREILMVVQQYVKKDGILVFSTCTVNRKENDENRQWFLENFDFEPVSISEYLPEKMHSETTEAGYLQLMPGKFGTDGFYISRFRRKS